MSLVTLATDAGPMTAYTAQPDGEGPWPGVVVIHDVVGMSQDLRRQVDWLAREGYLAIAPDLFHRGSTAMCLFRIIAEVTRRREGTLTADIDAARRWLLDRSDCTARLGVIGFCLGGGIAVMMAPTGRFGAASVNYGMVPRDAVESLADSCPVVGSYGRRDRTLRQAPHRLARALRSAGVDHDVMVYPDAGHAFLNDHDPAEVPRFATVMGKFSGSEYDAPTAHHARGRIAAFFARHLTEEGATGPMP